MTYVNLDGIEVEPKNQDYIDTWIMGEYGYTRVTPLRGELGCTELGLWTRTAYTIGITAFTRPDSHCAWVLLADGTCILGAFYQFENGTFSLA